MSEQNFHYEYGLESSRLTTRFLSEEDIEQWSDFFSEPEAIRYFTEYTGRPPRECSREWVERQLKRYREKSYGLQAIIEKISGEMAGHCGLLLQEVDGVVELEVGYSFRKKFWGQGYAPEAAAMFIDYAFAKNLSESLISIIDVENNNSRRVAEKNGLNPEKRTSWKGLDVVIYRISRADRERVSNR